MFAEFVFCIFLNCLNFSVLKTLVQFSDVTAMTCALHRLTCEGQRKLRARTCSACVNYWNASPFPSDAIEHVTWHMCIVAKSGLWHAFGLPWKLRASKSQQQTQKFTLAMVASLISLCCKRFRRKQAMEAQKVWCSRSALLVWVRSYSHDKLRYFNHQNQF